MHLVLATLEDYPPLVLATLGGFLQQLFGSRRLLQAAAVPTLLTWVVIIANPESMPCLLASRYRFPSSLRGNTVSNEQVVQWPL